MVLSDGSPAWNGPAVEPGQASSADPGTVVLHPIEVNAISAGGDGSDATRIQEEPRVRQLISSVMEPPAGSSVTSPFGGARERATGPLRQGRRQLRA